MFQKQHAIFAIAGWNPIELRGGSEDSGVWRSSSPSSSSRKKGKGVRACEGRVKKDCDDDAHADGRAASVSTLRGRKEDLETTDAQHCQFRYSSWTWQWKTRIITNCTDIWYQTKEFVKPSYCGTDLVPCNNI